MNSDLILGIDPGSQYTGFGLILRRGNHEQHVSHGVISIPDSLPLPGKLHYIHENLSAIISKYQPQHFSLEDIFLGKNAKSAFVLGHVRGVCLQLAYQHRLKINEFAARLVKKTVSGNGNASKEQIHNIVTRMLNISTNEKLDATDALAVAITYARHEQLQEIHKRALSL